jgi:hypothetical protein
MQSRPERLYRPLPQQTDGEMNQVEKAARFSELLYRSRFLGHRIKAYAA